LSSITASNGRPSLSESLLAEGGTEISVAMQVFRHDAIEQLGQVARAIPLHSEQLVSF
jgi:hypothetical protein